MKNLTLYSLAVFLILGAAFTFVFHSKPASIDVKVSPTQSNPTVAVKHPSHASEPFPGTSGSITTFPASSEKKPTVPQTSSTVADQAPAPGTPVLTIPGAPGEAGTPVVFSVSDVDKNLTADQVERIKIIRDKFTQQMTAGNPNPNDPAYLTRWQKAQSDADDQLRMVLDQEAYVKYLTAGQRADTNP